MTALKVGDHILQLKPIGVDGAEAFNARCSCGQVFAGTFEKRDDARAIHRDHLLRTLEQSLTEAQR